MKILHILISRGWNAQTANACLIIDQQIKQGHQVIVFAIENSKVSKMQRQKEKPSVPDIEQLSEYFFFRNRKSLSMAFKMSKFLKKDRIDIIHIHGASYGRFRTWLAFKLSNRSVPVFFSIRDKPKRKALARFLWFGYYKKLLFPNYLVESYYQRLVGANNNKALPFDIFAAPVDTTRFKPILNKPQTDSIVIGMFARFDPIKGFPYFFKACQKLSQTPNIPDCRFVIAGSNFGHNRSEIEEMIASHQLTDRITIYENLPNIEEIISQIDIGVITSIGSEEISRIALEYMSCGVPVVATMVGGITECISEKEGILIQARSVEELYSALFKLVLDDKLRLNMGTNGRNRVLRENSIIKLCQKLEENYQEALIFFKQH